ncbi:MAG: class C beta-lactamase-related serine hydrolase [Gemmatimonadales bacterium]|nr:MAG: class C beta-lactamase-related serine hydrolase [Gemmatimonadales bacterium]
MLMSRSRRPGPRPTDAPSAPTSGPAARVRALLPAVFAPLAVVLALAACEAPAPHPLEETRAWPGAEWEAWEQPEDGGFTAEGITRMEAALEELDTSSMKVVTAGRVAFEYGDVTEVSYLASVRKSILAILYGIHEDRGNLDLDRTLEELDMDDVRGLTEAERQATNRHLVESRSGVYHPASNPGDNLADAPEPGSQAPGSYYLYSNWDFNAAGTAFEVQTGLDLFDALEADLAEPLGFRDFDRERHRKGGDMERSVHPSYHMHISTRDKARIGLLMLREGEWDGEEVVSERAAREMTSVITPVTEMNPAARRDGPHGYGHMWWVWDGDAAQGPFEGAYAGVGAVGQYIVVLPALDMVVVHKTVPGQGRGVAHGDFWEVLDVVVDAWCGTECESADAG